ncbi:MAG: glycosyl transferase [Gammaproteobacteria bacterium RIFOXYD12_FULL_61_37]|nr:MAG: glycosyl transferase [Gammaproteobacteria bacterium RIFOXYD12_FULL_61_37]
MNAIGLVAIGRNEGERLRLCLASAAGRVDWLVYVDSGSTDGSVALARSLGAEVVELDLSIPFTAARARNAGFRRLHELAQGLAYVQFVDGDCELIEGWLARAAAFLEDHGDVAVACGRRRERFPERSIYNLLCDREWDTPVGEASACGGDALMRTDAFEAAGGYRESLIAGEEPELCLRLRAQGWRIWRLEAEMTLHDAAMARFGQWWRRSLRAGHAFAEGAWLHGRSPERHWVRESLSAWLWGAIIPLVTLGAVSLFGSKGLLLAGIYPWQILRLALRGGYSWRVNVWRALFLVLGKFSEVAGQLWFLQNRIRGRKARLIEYK